MQNDNFRFINVKDLYKSWNYSSFITNILTLLCITAEQINSELYTNAYIISHDSALLAVVGLLGFLFS